ncbi:zinc ribbon domain-containing protein [Anaeromicrobium sediminis]|uniref:Zinc-ribbon domain-containing protein n=1 Tax=Anaeromicrobium sediminis TaxID=1478221 RepID=A0A267MBR3_9FIRM|nr:zinc ribbon domain-containing protein [Anaeromicrobium sediminis]PAB56832.1 hypothetical protein CCE28_20370 [Anaeromicrobium sediminis]
MDFLERFIDSIGRGTHTLSVKTDEVIELTEMKMNIRGIEEEIEEHKLYIGEIVYKYYTEEKAHMPTSEIKRRCMEIRRLERKLNMMKERMVRKRGFGYCKNCGEIIKKKQNYCPRCGNRALKY